MRKFWIPAFAGMTARLGMTKLEFDLKQKIYSTKN